jgi:hypothetical protein
MNILRTQISYLCNLCKCLQIFHGVYPSGEHKAHVVQVNNKNHNLQRLIIRIFVFVDLIEQKEISKTKDGAPLKWEDTHKMKYTWCVLKETLCLQPVVEQAL